MRKGDIMLGAIAGIILLLTSFGIIGTAIKLGEQKVSAKIPGKLCQATNAARAATAIDTGVMEVNVVPRFCKTIHKAIPSKGYQQTTDGAKKEMKDMTTNCWWQWLEGGTAGMFGKSWPWSKNKCFVCYTYDIKKNRNVKSFSAEAFTDTLRSTAYIARDTSDKCNPAGGGYCTTGSCDPNKGWREVQSKPGICKKDRVCCVARSVRDECVNKGGRCEIGGCPSTYPAKYEDWSCGAGECCLEKENYFTTLDYIQFFNGQGRISIEGDIETFNAQGTKGADTYAIAFVQENDDEFWTHVVTIGGGVLLGVGIVIGTGGAGLIPLALGAGVGAGTGYLAKLGIDEVQAMGKDTHSQLLITKFNALRDKCLVQKV